MTKVGDNNLPPKMETKEHIQKTLGANIFKFEEALEQYIKSDSIEEQERLQAMMNGHLSLIEQSVSEIKRQGTHKQEVKVEKNYKDFMQSGSDESYAALKHDIITLRDYILS